MRGIKISKCEIRSINYWKGKELQSLLLCGKKTTNKYQKMVSTVSNVTKVKMLVIREKSTDSKINGRLERGVT